MFFLDVQGTLISDHDKSLIHGAKELIDFLNAKIFLILSSLTIQKNLIFRKITAKRIGYKRKCLY